MADDAERRAQPPCVPFCEKGGPREMTGAAVAGPREAVGAVNYAMSLASLNRCEEAKALLRKTIPVARRILGTGHDITLRMRLIYASALYINSGATLDDLREAVTTLEETELIARRVFGGAHPLMVHIERELHSARAIFESSSRSKK